MERARSSAWFVVAVALLLPGCRAPAKPTVGVGTSRRPAQERPAVNGPVTLRLASGSHHVCALAQQGEVWCWGANDWGQLGTGDVSASAEPVLVQGIPFARALDSGAEHTCIVAHDGEVWCWGRNASGESGPTSAGRVLVPQRVPGVRGAVDVALDSAPLLPDQTSGCAALAAGGVRCWGGGETEPWTLATPAPLVELERTRGLCGVDAEGRALCRDASVDSRGAADWVTRAQGIRQLSCTPRGLCIALDTIDQVHAWNGETPARIAFAPDEDQSFSLKVKQLGGVCALDDVGMVRCGQSTSDDVVTFGEPQSVPPAEAFAPVPGGMCFAHAGDAMTCRGWGGPGMTPRTPWPTPNGRARPLGDRKVSELRSHGGYLCGRLEREVQCWAALDEGQFPPRVEDGVGFDSHGGTGADSCSRRSGSAPTMCSGGLFTAATGSDAEVDVGQWQLTRGKRSVCGIGPTGQLWCGDDGEYVRLDISDPAEVAIGTGQTCARSGSGQVKCWSGLNTFGRPPAPRVLLNRDARAIAVAGNMTCAALETSVRCWGSIVATNEQDDERTLDVGGLGRVARLASDEATICALQLDGELRCWGTGFLGDGRPGARDSWVRGQVERPEDIEQLVVDGRQACTRRRDGEVECFGDVLRLRPGWSPTPESEAYVVPPAIVRRLVAPR